MNWKTIIIMFFFRRHLKNKNKIQFHMWTCTVYLLVFVCLFYEFFIIIIIIVIMIIMGFFFIVIDNENIQFFFLYNLHSWVCMFFWFVCLFFIIIIIMNGWLEFAYFRVDVHCVCVCVYRHFIIGHCCQCNDFLCSNEC